MRSLSSSANVHTDTASSQKFFISTSCMCFLPPNASSSMIPRSLKNQPWDHAKILAEELVSDKPARTARNRVYKWLTTGWVRSLRPRGGPEDENLPVTPTHLPLRTSEWKGKGSKGWEHNILTNSLMKLTSWSYSNKRHYSDLWCQHTAFMRRLTLFFLTSFRPSAEKSGKHVY